MNKSSFALFVIMLSLIPVFSFAQTRSASTGINGVFQAQSNYSYQGPGNYYNGSSMPATGKITDVNSLSYKLVNLGNLFTYLLMALAVIFIIWNVVIYMIRPSEGDRTEATKSITYGIVGLFIILSLWGLVNILLGTFNTNYNAPTDRFPTANFLK